MKIELHKQFKVPIDGLIPLAEEITIQKEKRAAEAKPFIAKASKQGESPAASPRAALDESEQSVADKKQRKKMVKAQQREKRQLKKQLKQAFNQTLQTQVANEVTEQGGIRKGVSVKKIY